jgi:hypothetical protein
VCALLERWIYIKRLLRLYSMVCCRVIFTLVRSHLFLECFSLFHSCKDMNSLIEQCAQTCISRVNDYLMYLQRYYKNHDRQYIGHLFKII